MDPKRFDDWTRNRALRLSRRSVLRLATGTGVATALAAHWRPAGAESTCSLTLRARTLSGPSASTAYDGTLRLTLGADRGLAQATFTPSSGAPQTAFGQVTGRAIDLQLTLGPSQPLALSGAGDQPVARCQGAFGGIFTGPQPGDLGVWQATAAASLSTVPASSGQSSSSTETTCPAPQTLCDGACIDTRSDPEHCGGCNVACAAGTCNSGACAGQACTPDGETCKVPADCCSGLCPHETQASGICGCSQIGGVCAGQDDCCQQGGDTLVACIGGPNSDRCIVLNGACTSDSDCVSQSCVNGQCGTSCRQDGEPCQSTSDCCNPGCFGNICGCAKLGQSCSDDFWCCEGTPVICFAGACCILDNFACTADADCCSYQQGNGFCTNGVCTRSS